MIQPTYLFVVALSASATAIASCSSSTPQAAPTKLTCDELIAKAAVDELCAIQLAQAELIRRDGRLDFSKFEATYDSKERAWSVMAMIEPMMPGGHVFVSVGIDGKVRYILPGR
jgi:hypothetical protein